MNVQNKYSSNASRLLRFLAIIESKVHGSSEWYRIAKRAVHHYILSQIFSPFTGYDNNKGYVFDESQ